MASCGDEAWVMVSVLAYKWLTEPLFHGFEGSIHLILGFHGRGRSAYFHLPESRYGASCNCPRCTAICHVLTPLLQLVVSFYDTQFYDVCSWACIRRVGSLPPFSF